MENNMKITTISNFLWDKENTTAIKGFAIICVILSHVANFWGVSWFTPLGGIGVSMFLIMSGYGLTLSYKKNGLTDFWQKRVVSAYIPYAITCLFAPLLGATFKQVGMSILLIKPFSAYWWFMQYLFIWYTLFGVVNALRISGKMKMRLFVMVAVICFVVCRTPLRGEQAFSFVIGVLLATYGVKWKKYMVGILAMLIGVFALAIKQIPMVRNADITYLWNFIQLLNKVGISIGVIFIMVYARRLVKSRLMQFIGNISFELYLVHSYTIRLVSQSNVKIERYALFIVITIVCAILFNYINRQYRSFLIKRK